MKYKGRKVELCHQVKEDLYQSPNCSDLEDCFFPKNFKRTHYSNQSPGFSLCYQIGGDAFFGDIKGVGKRIPMCKKHQYFADQENLLLFYRDSILVK